MEMQLLIVLNRLGCDGNCASIDRSGLFFGRSVGTVEKFTDRVFEAIFSLEKDYVFWPDADERSDISDRMDIKHGLKHAVGIVDRLIQLEFLFLELEFAILKLSKVTIDTAGSITLHWI